MGNAVSDRSEAERVCCKALKPPRATVGGNSQQFCKTVNGLTGLIRDSCEKRGFRGGIGFDWVRFAGDGGGRLLHNAFRGKGLGLFSALDKLGSFGFDWVCFE